MACSLHWLPKDGVSISTESEFLALEMSIKKISMQRQQNVLVHWNIRYQKKVVSLVGHVYARGLKDHSHKAAY